MKNIKQSLADWRRKALAASGSLVLLIGLNAVAQPFASPVGEWDVVMSGSRQGVARFTFGADHTFTVTEIVIPKNLVSNSDPRSVNDSRGTGGDDTRGGTLTNNTALPAHTNLYGFITLPSAGELNFTNFSDSGPTGAIWVHDGVPAGQWNFDGSGKLIGYFTELGPPVAITTNIIPFGQPTISDCQDVVITDSNGQPALVQVCLTNQPYLTNVEVLRLTNAINFTGKVSLNPDLTKTRLTLLATTPAGKSTFSGVLPVELADMSGNWYGLNRHAGLPYNEFFSLGLLDDFNLYGMSGTGAGYLLDGGLLIVRQKKFGYVVNLTTPHNPPPDVETIKIRVVIGSIDLNHGKFSGSGLEDTDKSVDRIRYKASMLPPDLE